MKVRGLLYARELRERVAYIGADIGRGSCRGRGGVTAVGKADVQVDAVGLAGEACRERGEAEAREVGSFALAGGEGVGIVMIAMLFQPRSQTWAR